MDVVTAIAAGVLVALIVIGLDALRSRIHAPSWRRGIDLAAGTPGLRVDVPPGYGAIGLHAGAIRLHAPRVISFPVDTLAGLPIRRPVTDGWTPGPKMVDRERLREVIVATLSASCDACADGRARGLRYCVECGRRLAPYLR